MTSQLGLLGSMAFLSAKSKRLATAFLKPALLPLLSFAHAGNTAPYASAV